MADVTLSVTLTEDQYLRFQAGMKELQNMEDNPTDEQLVAQMKREAAAITYAAEVGSGDGSNWTF